MAGTSFPLGNPFGSARTPISAGAMAGGPPTMDTSQLDSLLQSYGVQLPSSYVQPGPLENSPMQNSHPGLARGLDNALITASLMGPSGRTAGENISNAARGVLGVGPYRREFQAQQAMLPLQVAGVIGGLQAQQGAIKRDTAMAGYYGDRGQAALETVAQKTQAAITRENMLGTKQMQLGKDSLGNPVVQEPFIDPHDADMQVQWRNRPDIDPHQFAQQQTHGKIAQGFGGGVAGETITLNLEQKYGDKLPALLQSPTSEFIRDLNSTVAGVNKMSGSYQGTQLRQDSVPASTAFQERVKANQVQLGGMKYGIKDHDKAVKNEASRLMRSSADSGGSVDLKQLQTQAEANVSYKEDHDRQLDDLYGRYAQLPPEVQGSVDFSSWAQKEGGYNPQSHTFATHGTAPPGATPPASPMGGLSPSDQAIINSIQGIFKK